MKNVFLFPGQGTQYPGMGSDLYKEFSSVRELFELASSLSGLDLRRILSEGSEEELKQTKTAQIYISLVNVSAAEALRERGLEAESCAGFSLGEYSALWYAGVLSTEDLFKAVVKRGELMSEAIRELPDSAGGLGMLAVLGLTYGEVSDVLAPLQQRGLEIYIANYNAARQIVLGGRTEALEQAEPGLDEAGAMRCVPLKVEGPFHTPLMRGAAEPFAAFLEEEIHFSDPRIGLYSNVTGKPVLRGREIAGLAVRQIYSPVLWVDVETNIMEDGVKGLWEVGPGNVLTGLWRQFNRRLACSPMGTLEQIQAFSASA